MMFIPSIDLYANNSHSQPLADQPLLNEQEQKAKICQKVIDNGGLQVMGLGAPIPKMTHICNEDLNSKLSESLPAENVKKSRVKRNLFIIAGVLALVGAALLIGGGVALGLGAAIAIYAPLMATGAAFLLAGGILAIIALCLKNKNKSIQEEQSI